jgi:hypothetical protein
MNVMHEVRAVRSSESALEFCHMKSRAFLASVLTAVVFAGFTVEAQRANAALAAQPGTRSNGGPVVGSPALPSAAAPIPGPVGGINPPTSLLPRAKVRKPKQESFVLPFDPETGEAWFTGNLVLKFEDHVGARAARTDSPAPFSTNGASIEAFSQILADNKLTVRQWINRTPGELANLEERARLHSGRAQPDLAGMMIIENVEPTKLVEIARAINALPEIEFVDIERIPVLHQGCGPDAPGPCNVPDPVNCAVANDDGVGIFECNADPGGDNPTFGCQDATCCQLVATRLPYCNNGDLPQGWDLICAAYANLLCVGTIYDNENPPLQDRYDPCFTDPNNPPSINPLFADFVPGLQAGCFEPHAGRGCNQPSCCYAVCNFDPACCNTSWDQNCVNLALSPNLENSCGGAAQPGPTPDFTFQPSPSAQNPFLVGNYQLYTQNNRANPTPDDPTVPVFPGSRVFGGQGLDLAGFDTLQQEVSTAYQGGIAPRLRGQSIRVAVIEFSAFVNHEEFTKDANGNLLAQPKVIQEPGQTILLIQGANNEPQHGTAALGEIVSGNNGFGVTGISYNAQGYFFPIVSIEEGSRAQNAIVSCLEVFRAGDVVNHSWGSPPDRPLPAIAQYYTLIALGSDLGITTSVSAGNSNCPIQPEAGEADSGCIIVGAGHSGRRVSPGQGGIDLCPGYNACVGAYMRAPFSNYTGEDGATVHVMAWGENVATTGYGDLFIGENDIPANDSDPTQLNQLRTYTAQFSGTSSASPIIAGAVTNLQAFAKQVYGNPLPPTGVRGAISGQVFPQCDAAVSQVQCGQSIADCCINGDPDCDGEFKPVGGFPRMRDAGIAVFTGSGWDSNTTNVRVVRGEQPAGSAWTSFLIRVADGQSFRINSVRGRAGNIVEGLTYLATGNITDMFATVSPPIPNPQTSIFDISLRYLSRSTRNFVMLNAFVKNFETNRWEYIGANFLTVVYPAAPQGFSIPNSSNYAKYLNPSSGNIEMRIWTVGLGAPAPHAVEHDLIELGVNDPLVPL